MLRRSSAARVCTLTQHRGGKVNYWLESKPIFYEPIDTRIILSLASEMKIFKITLPIRK